jgi:hypothetical protein
MALTAMDFAPRMVKPPAAMAMSPKVAASASVREPPLPRRGAFNSTVPRAAPSYSPLPLPLLATAAVPWRTSICAPPASFNTPRPH